MFLREKHESRIWVITDTITKYGDAYQIVSLARETAPTCNSIRGSFVSQPVEIPVLIQGA